MFVEGDVEIKVKDRSVTGLDDHDFKLWVQRAFKDGCCYRISSFHKESDKIVRATVALNTSVLPPTERTMLEGHPNDVGSLRTFMERMFIGKGTCRCVGDPGQVTKLVHRHCGCKHRGNAVISGLKRTRRTLLQPPRLLKLAAVNNMVAAARSFARYLRGALKALAFAFSDRRCPAQPQAAWICFRDL
ncbi:MAG: hypothetical protein R3C68_08135 [Myxococcota bacterium]